MSEEKKEVPLSKLVEDGEITLFEGQSFTGVGVDSCGIAGGKEMLQKWKVRGTFYNMVKKQEEVVENTL